jgi:hypothetical protein
LAGVAGDDAPAREDGGEPGTKGNAGARRAPGASDMVDNIAGSDADEARGDGAGTAWI